jgi:Yip1 domain
MEDILKIFVNSLPQYFDLWMSAISDPGHFLKQGFRPTNAEITEGLKFYLAVMAASLIVFGLITIFVEQGSLAIKAKMLANGLLGIVFLFVAAIVIHFPIWLLGGAGTFYGTLLAYIYAGTPYAPLIAIAQWVLVAGMPPRLRRYALNPATAQVAGQVAGQDPETDKVTFFIGSLIVLGLTGWTIYLTFRWLSIVHDMSFWRFAFVIVIWFVISIPVGLIFKRMASLIYDAPAAAGATQDS